MVRCISAQDYRSEGGQGRVSFDCSVVSTGSHIEYEPFADLARTGCRVIPVLTTSCRFSQTKPGRHIKLRDLWPKARRDDDSLGSGCFSRPAPAIPVMRHDDPRGARASIRRAELKVGSFCGLEPQGLKSVIVHLSDRLTVNERHKSVQKRGFTKVVDHSVTGLRELAGCQGRLTRVTT